MGLKSYFHFFEVFVVLVDLVFFYFSAEFLRNVVAAQELLAYEGSISFAVQKDLWYQIPPPISSVTSLNLAGRLMSHAPLLNPPVSSRCHSSKSLNSKNGLQFNILQVPPSKKLENLLLGLVGHLSDFSFGAGYAVGL